MTMKIAVGADHAGFEAKDAVAGKLRQMGHQVEDFGTNSPEACDYPVPAQKVAEAVSSGKADRGILVCGNGVGMTIAANKVPGVRAALVYSVKVAEGTRDHNDSNVLVLAGREFPVDVNVKIAETWMATPFSKGDRHIRRIGQISDIEKKYFKG